jgi:hypothetical protein
VTVDATAGSRTAQVIEISVKFANRSKQMSSSTLGAAGFARVGTKGFAGIQLGSAESRALHSARVD